MDAASHVDKCIAGEVGMGCQKMTNDLPTVTRAELDAALERVRDADERLHRLKRRTFWGLAWRRASPGSIDAFITHHDD